MKKSLIVFGLISAISLSNSSLSAADCDASKSFENRRLDPIPFQRIPMINLTREDIIK